MKYLPPGKMMGIESNGMLLSMLYNYEGEEALNFILLDDNIPAGAMQLGMIHPITTTRSTKTTNWSTGIPFQNVIYQKSPNLFVRDRKRRKRNDNTFGFRKKYTSKES